jgi:hypothetical protein
MGNSFKEVNRFSKRRNGMGIKLDWGVWVYGLFAALIGGGAGGVSSGLAGMHLAPGQFGAAGDAGWNTLKLMGFTFIFAAIISVVAYLMKSPLPAIETTVSVSQTTQPGQAVKTTTTIAATSSAPRKDEQQGN